MCPVQRKLISIKYIIMIISGQLTMMYNAKEFGLIQIKDIKKNNDYADSLAVI